MVTFDERSEPPETAPACTLCGSPDVTLLLHEPGRRYFACSRCTLIFLDPANRLLPLQEILRYQTHRNSGDDPGYVAFLRRLADPVMAVVPAGARGLDFGCGPAPVLSELLTAAGRPTAFHDPLFHPTNTLDARYDFVTCSEVVEHAHSPAALFEQLGTLVVPGGIIGVMTRFYGIEAPFERWWYRRDPTHVSFYDAGTFGWIARHRGWTLELPVPNVALFTVA